MERAYDIMREARFREDEIAAIDNLINSKIDIAAKNIVLNLMSLVFGDELKEIDENEPEEEIKLEELPEFEADENVKAPEGDEVVLPEESEDNGESDE